MNPVPSLPALVRESCAKVCETAALVALDPDRLASIGDRLKLPSKQDDLVEEHFLTQHNKLFEPRAAGRTEFETRGFEMRESRMMERSALLVFALDAINFGSGYHDIIDKLPGLSGARSMEANLRDFEAGAGPLTPAVLRTLSASRCAIVFRQELHGSRPGNTKAERKAKAELMALFSTAFGALATWLDNYEGQALQAIEAANGSAVTLATMLLGMPFYRDRAHYDRAQSVSDRALPGGLDQPSPQHPAATNLTSPAPSATVHFYKRAQITPADLQRELNHPLFDDLDKLTAFADNLVPHLLRIDGAIILDQELENRINTGMLLPAGSPAEIEIRAAGIEAVRQLAQLTGRTEMELDLLLWTQGRQPKYKNVPRHRCRTVFY